MTPFLSETSTSVHVRVMLVDIIISAVGTPGLPEGPIEKTYNRIEFVLHCFVLFWLASRTSETLSDKTQFSIHTYLFL